MQNPTLLFNRRSNRTSWRALLSLIVLLAGLGSAESAWAQNPSFSDEAITLIQQPTGAASSNASYAGTQSDSPYYGYRKLGTTATNPVRANPNIGTYDVNTPITSQLTFTGGSIVARPAYDQDIPGPIGTISGARILYRIFAKGAAMQPEYSALTLTDGGPFAGSSSKRIYNNTTSVDLLSSLLGAGKYVIDVQFQVDVTNNATTTTYTDPSNSYQAEFDVTAPAVTPAGGSTTWISSTDTPNGTNWLNPANWTNGVPTRNADAIIPDKAPTTGFTVTPLLSSPTETYEVRTLTLNGETNGTRALLRIGRSTTNDNPVGATLRVYGDLNNFAGGVLGGVIGSPGVADPNRNSTVVFARNDGTPQAVRGLLSVTDISIEGSGIKAVIDEIDVLNTLTFNQDPTKNGAILRTAVDNANFDLKTTQTAKVVITSNGKILGEVSNSFIQGITLAERSLTAGVTETFGNIGLDITPSLPLSGTTKITRTVGDPLAPPAFASKPLPIKRQYGVTGDINNNNVSTIVFHYLNSVDNELNGNPEANLTIFKTGNNGPPYQLVGRDGTVDLANHTVTRIAYDGSLNTLTLGDQANPLPVVLVSFNAVRSSNNALLKWATASEKNSDGFEVQVSIDGTSFRRLAFVNSKNANSTQKSEYVYTDQEEGKTGARYYRLKQVDIDGTSAFSPIRVVIFSGAIQSATALSGYPNPFNNTVAFNLDATTVGDGVAHVQLVDMTGRIVREQDLTVANASLTLDGLDSLQTGLYLAKLTLPDGSTQKVRVQKQ